MTFYNLFSKPVRNLASDFLGEAIKCAYGDGHKKRLVVQTIIHLHKNALLFPCRFEKIKCDIMRLAQLNLMPIIAADRFIASDPMKSCIHLECYWQANLLQW